jgi:isoleucyl-tRNA synthetase
MDGKLRTAVDDFDFNTYTRLLSDFANNDLSAFFFDIRKDSLYCDAPTALKRRAYRTVLDTLLHALVRYAAPVLVFTAEEVWGTRYPDAGSVHLLEWPEVDAGWVDPSLNEQWTRLRDLRLMVSAEIEPLRREKTLGSSLQASVTLGISDVQDRPTLTSEELAELFIVADVGTSTVEHGPVAIVHLTIFEKCGRCWRHLPEVTEDGALCDRCTEVVA